MKMWIDSRFEHHIYIYSLLSLKGQWTNVNPFGIWKKKIKEKNLHHDFIIIIDGLGRTVKFKVHALFFFLFNIWLIDWLIGQNIFHWLNMK